VDLLASLDLAFSYSFPLSTASGKGLRDGCFTYAVGAVTSGAERSKLERMGTVTISFEMTLDGVFDQMEHWFDENDPGVQRASDELVFGADAVLLGRESYEFFREYWPAQSDDRGFAAHYNALPKYVASTTLTGPLDWNSTLIEGDVAEAVRGLRDRYSSIISHGYGGLAAALVDAGLVDEIHAGIHPFMVGNAEHRLRTPHPVGLRLLDVQSSESGIIAARYAPV
jgi:dihydrofolate reductase